MLSATITLFHCLQARGSDDTEDSNGGLEVKSSDGSVKGKSIFASKMLVQEEDMNRKPTRAGR